jgi:hypothetical protein
MDENGLLIITKLSIDTKCNLCSNCIQVIRAKRSHPPRTSPEPGKQTKASGTALVIAGTLHASSGQTNPHQTKIRNPVAAQPTLVARNAARFHRSVRRSARKTGRTWGETWGD